MKIFSSNSKTFKKWLETNPRQKKTKNNNKILIVKA